MKLFDVYPVYPIEPVKAKGSYIWDKDNNQYLDLYGGHAVISIGHSHPAYIETIKNQLEKIAFYSNSVEIPLQNILAEKLGKLSGYETYNLFLCNSGAEANENALKLASFKTNKSKVLAFKGGFHGRTSGAVAITDNAKIIAPFNSKHQVELVDWNDIEAAETALKQGDVCAVIAEGIQGLAGINLPEPNFFIGLHDLCKKYGALLILDEVQSGYGRTGKFFAHQHYGVIPDIITMAKGMGNGFPIGGIIINPTIEASYGLLGTTFGGNHLACAAAIAVLDVLESENLIQHAADLETKQNDLFKNTKGLKAIRNKGLMTGLEFEFPIKELRGKLVTEHKIFTGSSANPNTLRLLPPLCIEEKQLNFFKEKLDLALKNSNI